MGVRSISVRVSAEVAGYLTSFQAATAVTREFGDASLTMAAKHEKSLTRVGTVSATAGALVLAGLGVATLAAAKFDAQMSVVKANIDDKSAPSMKRLSDAALKAGQTTAYSATDAAKAEEELAKAGLTSAQITGGALAAALNLASAGQLDLGTAAEITASTMVQFGLSAKDAAHIADDLAAGADKSLGGVQDLAEALKYAGVPASQFGISLDQTVGVLAEFASNGIEGSMAGTSFRQMLISLASPTAAAQETLDKYGITVFDTNGKFLGMAQVAQQLHDKLGNLTQQQQQAALSTIFTARSVSTANILMRDGAAGVDKWTKAVNDQGFAAQQASTKLDNLSGDARKLRNTIETDLIKAGQDGQGVLRGLTKTATDVAKGIGDLPDPIRKTAEVVIGGSGAVALLGGSLSVALPKIQAFRTALAELAPEGTLASSALGALPGVIGAATAALAAAALIYEQFASDKKYEKDQVSSFTQALQADSGVVGQNSRQYAANQLQREGALKLAKQAGISESLLTDAVLGSSSAMAKLNAASKKNADTAWAATNVAKALNKEFEKGKSAYDATAAAAKTDADSTNKSGDAKAKAAEEQKKLTQAAQDFAKANASNPAYELDAALVQLGPDAAASTDKIKAFNTAMQDFEDLALGIVNASAQAGDALASMAKNGAKGASVQQILAGDVLRSNAATRTLSENLASVSSGYVKQLSEVYKNTAATKGNDAAIIAVNKTHAEQVAALKRTLAQMGITGKAADSLVAKYATIPSNISTDVKLAQVAQAKAAADSVKRSIDNIPKQHTTVTQAQISELQRKLAQAKAEIKGVPGSKAVAVNAEISEAQRRLAIIAQALANLQSKDITVRERTIKTTEIQTIRHSNFTATGHAGGGRIDGPGTETSDSIMTPTSRNEYVTKAASARSVGYAAMDYINKYGRLPTVSMAPARGYATASSSPAGAGAQPIIQVDTFNQYASTTATDVAEQFWYLTKARG